jgi:6-phosphogluconolactonase
MQKLFESEQLFLARAVDPSGRFAYVTNFTGNNVSGYTIDPSTGALTAIAGSPFTAGHFPTSVMVDLSGRFVYVTNGTDNNISGYAIDPATGALTTIVGSPFAAGIFPLNMTPDPVGTFAYSANGGDPRNVVRGYKINPYTGAPTAVAGSPFTGSPFNGGIFEATDSLAITPDGKFLYATSNANIVLGT